MFKFELNSVLALKEKIEDVKKRELGLANTHKEILLQQKLNLQNRQEALCEELRYNVSATFNSKDLRVLNRYNQHIKGQIKQKEVAITKAQRVVDQKRDELLQAVKERKILDNLKEIRFEQYIEGARRLEQLILDEMVSYKYGEVKRSEE